MAPRCQLAARRCGRDRAGDIGHGRPVGEALLPAAAVFVLAAAGGGWRQAIGKAAVVCAAFALPILVYCTGSYLITGNFFLSHQGVTSLYGRTAAAITVHHQASARRARAVPEQKPSERGDVG